MRRLLTAALTVGFLFLAMAPATAGDEIGLSWDGTQWTDGLTEPLFDPSARWVPGDSHAFTFYVRNQADTKARLTATIRSKGREGMVVDGHVTLRARVNGAWFPLRDGKPSDDLTAAGITSGDVVRVDIRAAFDPASTNASQETTADLQLDIWLDDALESVNGATDASEDENATASIAGWLPRTGAQAPVELIWVAALATVVGGAFVAAGRHRSEEESDAA